MVFCYRNRSRHERSAGRTIFLHDDDCRSHDTDTIGVKRNIDCDHQENERNAAGGDQGGECGNDQRSKTGNENRR